MHLNPDDLPKYFLFFLFFSFSPSLNAQTRIDEQLVLMYNFFAGEGQIIRDDSGVDPLVHLTIDDVSKVRWIQDRGLHFKSGQVRAVSGGSARKLFDKISSTNQLTVEVWMQSDALNQVGPARIVSYSKDTSRRNFTLGQQNGDLAMRIRTPQSGLNGSKPGLLTKEGISTNLQHVVATFDGTRSRAYIDGALQSETLELSGGITDWDPAYPFMLANEGEDGRQWLGKLYLVAVYSKALSQNEVAQNFQAGLPQSGGEQPPEAPEGLQAAALSGSAVEVSWSDNSINEKGFAVEQSESDSADTFVKIADLPPNSTRYVVTGLSPGTTYRFRVFAYNDAGDSQFSDTTIVTTAGEQPAIALLSPTQEETIKAGSTHAVRWQITGYDGDVRIEFSENGGLAWSTLVELLGDLGEYVWHVPTITSTQCLIKVSAVHNASLSAETNSPFAIVPDLSFTDITGQAGTGGPEGFHQTGGHAAIFSDVDRDGRPDLYISMLFDSPRPDLFYRNTEGGVFAEEGAQRGISDFDGGTHGAVFADLDNDGDFDLYNGTTGLEGSPEPNNIFENDGTGHFIDVTNATGAKFARNPTRGVAAFDMDGDGDLDLFSVTNHRGSEDPAGERNEVYRNLGQMRFETVETGELYGAPAGQGAIDTDFDGDGDVDILAANRSGEVNILRNDGVGNFTRVPPATLGITHRAGDGITTGDIDNDGDLDLLLVDEPNGFLYKNDGNSSFSFAQEFLNIAGYMGAFADLDNDTDLDLVFAGHDMFYLNDGHGNFSPGGQIPVAGIDDPRSVSFADIDDDGDLDFAIGCKRSRNWLVRNDFNAGNWLKVKLVSPAGQAGAFGAKVRLFPTGQIDAEQLALREARSTQGYLGQDDQTLHFGLGNHQEVDIVVSFLNDATTTLSGVAANQTIVIDHSLKTPRLTLHSPQGGENWRGGATENITWSTSGTIAFVRLEFSPDNGASWQTIDNNIDNVGSYAWHLPDLHSTDCLVRISDAADGSPSARSETTFVIESPIVDVTPPIVSNVSITGITSHSAIVDWTTDEPATGQVEFGTDEIYGSLSQLQSSLTTTHSLKLSGLSTKTGYHLRIRSQDEHGNAGASGDHSFKTLGPTRSSVSVLVEVDAYDEWDFFTFRVFNTSESESITSIVLSGPQDKTFDIFKNGSSSTVLPPLGVNNDRNSSSQVSITFAAAGLVAGASDTNGRGSDLDGSVEGLQVSVYFSDGSVLTGETVNIGDHDDGNPDLWVFEAAGEASIDETPPKLTDIRIVDIGLNGATIVWLTDEIADSQVEYGLDPDYGSGSSRIADLVTSHSVVLSGLGSDTQYHVRAISNDTNGNRGVSGDLIFRTLRPDTEGPVISDLITSAVTSSAITIEWKTDEKSRGEIEYGLGTGYGGRTGSAPELTTSHEFVLSGLSAATTYHYRVLSSDSENNRSFSSDHTFTTLPRDSTAPSMTAPEVTDIDGSTVSVAWSTDEQSSGKIEYGFDSAYGNSTAWESLLSLEHSIVLSNLSPGRYHFRVLSRDASGNIALGDDATFEIEELPSLPVGVRLEVDPYDEWNFFTFRIFNTSEEASITAVTLRGADSRAFDVFKEGTYFSVSPDLGGNNDSNRQREVTLSFAGSGLAPGQSDSNPKGSDLDGTTEGLEVRISYSNGATLVGRTIVVEEHDDGNPELWLFEVIAKTEDNLTPRIVSFAPQSGSVGTEVVIRGSGFSSGSKEAPVKIMPLGNSITQGVVGANDNAGYRNDLAELLEVNGVAFDFVGSLANGAGFDADHEGHAGFWVDEILADLHLYLDLTRPNVILLHIGTNDISGNQTVENTLDDAEGILDTIHQFDPQIVVLLSSLIPRKDSKDPITTEYNQGLSSLLTSKRAFGHRIYYVGMNEAFKSNPSWALEYFPANDSIHPNDVGYAVMAGLWSDVLVGILSDPTDLHVAFAGVQATEVTVSSDEQIRAKVPHGATTGPIEITNLYGTGSSTQAFVVETSTMAALAITYPKGGQHWQPGSTHSLQWSSLGAIERVKLEYSTDRGRSWNAISEETANDGRFEWTIPDQASGSAFLRVSDARNSRTVAASGAVAIARQRSTVRRPGFGDLKRAILEPSDQVGNLVARSDLNRDGEVNVLDILASLDSPRAPFPLTKPQDKLDARQGVDNPVKVIHVLNPLADGDFNAEISVESATPIRAFQIRVEFDGENVESSIVNTFHHTDMMFDSFVTENSIELLGYVLNQNRGVDINDVLLTLSVHLRLGSVNESEMAITKALFVGRDGARLSVRLDKPTAQISNLPAEFSLSQNYPNPFNPATQIGFKLPAKSQVQISVYNLKGQLVRVLLNEEVEAGSHKVEWNGRNESGASVASGLYVYRIQAGRWTKTRTMTLMR